MAFKLEHTETTGAVWANAYHRVVIVNLDYAAEEAYIRVNIYKDQAARTENKEPVGISGFYINVANPDEGKPGFADIFATPRLSPAEQNPVKAAYSYVGSLPEYKTAVVV